MSGQKASIFLLVGFLLIGGVLVFMKGRLGRDSDSRTAPVEEAGPATLPSASGPPPTATRVTLPFVYSTEKEDWLRGAVADFEKAHPDVDVQLEAKGSLDAVRALLAGESKPVLWSPADSLAVNLLTERR